MALNRGEFLKSVESASTKPADQVQDFRIGDSVDVHQWILEGYDKEGNEKKRIQIFSGVVIARRSSGTRAMFTVRRIVQGEGVERTFPLHSPKIAKIVVKKTGRVRRAKLYFLRDRVGKATRLKEGRKLDLIVAAGGEVKTDKKG